MRQVPTGHETGKGHPQADKEHHTIGSRLLNQDLGGGKDGSVPILAKSPGI